MKIDIAPIAEDSSKHFYRYLCDVIDDIYAKGFMYFNIQVKQVFYNKIIDYIESRDFVFSPNGKSKGIFFRGVNVREVYMDEMIKIVNSKNGDTLFVGI